MLEIVLLTICAVLAGLTFVAFRSSRRAGAELRRLIEAHDRAQANSRHCQITGLANQQRAAEWLDHAFSARDVRPAVLIVGFAPFAPGPEREARLARAAARILSNAVKGDCLVARLDAGRYILALDGSGGGPELVALARTVATGLGKLVVDAQRARVGVALAVGSDTPTSLISRAEDAFAKCDGSGPVSLAFSDAELLEAIKQRTFAAGELASSIADHRIEPFFQPFVELGSGRVLGFEVLARWRHDDGRVRLPGEFLPLAEESGLVGPMFYSLLKAATLKARSWPDEWSLALNLSAEQFGDAMLVERTIGILLASGIGVHRLEIEISEQALGRDIEAAHKLVGAFRARGVRVTLDNFGGGNLHLRELARFPFDRIKVDCGAIERESGGDAGTALGLIAAAARHLGVPVLVQGIETHAGAEAAQVHGCAIGQGYLFGRPDPKTECFRLEGALAREHDQAA